MKKTDPELAALVRAGDIRARQELLTRHMGLVKAIASTYARHGMLDIDDLAQAAALALFTRLQDWNPDAGAFGTFAGAIVEGAIRTEIRRCNAPVAGCHRMARVLRQIIDTEPTTHEQHRRRDRARVALAAQQGDVRVALETSERDDERPVIDTLASDAPNAEELLELASYKAALPALLRELPPRYRKVIERQLAGESIESIAIEMGREVRSVRTYASHALARLRAMAAEPNI